MIYTNLKLWLVDSQRMFGRRVCPCFEPSGDPELDRKLLCPGGFVADALQVCDLLREVLFYHLRAQKQLLATKQDWKEQVVLLPA